MGNKKYNITVSGYGHKQTYYGLESELHEEFYVNAIDAFNDYLDKLGIKRPMTFKAQVEALKCSYYCE